MVRQHIVEDGKKRRYTKNRHTVEGMIVQKEEREVNETVC